MRRAEIRSEQTRGHRRGVKGGGGGERKRHAKGPRDESDAQRACRWVVVGKGCAGALTGHGMDWMHVPQGERGTRQVNRAGCRLGGKGVGREGVGWNTWGTGEVV